MEKDHLNATARAGIRLKSSSADDCSLTNEYDVWLNTVDAAAFLSTTPETVRNWVSYRKIPHSKKLGRLRFLKSDLHKFLLSGMRGN